MAAKIVFSSSFDGGKSSLAVKIGVVSLFGGGKSTKKLVGGKRSAVQAL